jgi:hypothetical protein
MALARSLIPIGDRKMSYPAYMTDEQLRTDGFVVSPDNPNLAHSILYPTLSYRHRCPSCGMWSGLTDGLCRQCHQGKKPIKITKQYYKLYLCCDDETCPIRQQAFSILREAGIDPTRPRYEKIGIDLALLKTFSEEKRVQFFDTINNISVSKHGARKLRHEGSKMRSKLPKSKS